MQHHLETENLASRFRRLQSHGNRADERPSVVDDVLAGNAAASDTTNRRRMVLRFSNRPNSVHYVSPQCLSSETKCNNLCRFDIGRLRPRRNAFSSAANGMAPALSASAAAMRWSSVLGPGAAISGGSTISNARAGPRWASPMAMGASDGAARCSTVSVRSSPSRRRYRLESPQAWRLSGTGVAGAFSGMMDDEHSDASEPARIMTAIGDSKTNRWHLQIANRWVVQYNFYINDRQWGRMFVRICPYLPFSARVCLNQHHWLANRMGEEGIAFKQCANAFMGCAKPERLQQLANSLTPWDLLSCGQKWLARLTPFVTAREREQAGCQHRLFFSQVEFCDNLIFRRRAALAQLGCRDRLNRTVEVNPLNRVADIAAVEHVADVRQRHDDEPPLELAQTMLDSCLDVFEVERVLVVDPLRIAHCDAGLADSREALHDQRAVPVVERLVAANEQRRRLFRIEYRAQSPHRLLCPVFRSAVGGDPQIAAFRRHEHAVGIGEGAHLNAVDEDQVCLTATQKCVASGRRRANEIGDGERADFHHLIAQPPIRRACSMRSTSEKPRSLLTFARSSSALKCTASRRGASCLASVVLPAPGSPMIRIFLHVEFVSRGGVFVLFQPLTILARHSLSLAYSLSSNTAQISAAMTAARLMARLRRHPAAALGSLPLSI